MMHLPSAHVLVALNGYTLFNNVNMHVALGSHN